MTSSKRWLLASLYVAAVGIPLQANTITLSSPGGNESVDGGLRVIVDTYGAFGSAADPAGDAWFNPPGGIGAAGTTFESGVFLRGSGADGFLAQGDIFGSGNLPSIGFQSTTASSAVSAFSRGNLSFGLTQTVQDRFDSSGTKVGSVLVQEYAVTNTGTASASISLVRYVDGDLYFSGGFSNDWGGASTTDQAMNQQLFEFDSGDDPADPTTLFAIRSIGGVVPESYFEVSAYPGLGQKIVSGGALDNAVHGDGADADLVTDGSYDITLAQQRDVQLSPQETRMYTTVTEFGLGTTGEAPVDPIAPAGVTIDRPYGRRAGQYSLEFTAQQELLATINVHLTGDAPTGPGNEDLQDIWEQGIETAWSGQYEVLDGIHRYPLVLDVNYVDTAAAADVTVTVHSGNGGVSSLNFYTDNPSGWGFAYQGIIAAHEAGHWLGLWDEYNPMNNGDPAIWPLWNADGTMLTDFWDLYDGVNGSPLADWAALSAAADQSGLMGANGSMEERYYQNLLDWLLTESGRAGLVLAEAPTFIDRSPLPGIPDAAEPVIPEPLTMVGLLAGLTGCAGYARKRLRPAA